MSDSSVHQKPTKKVIYKPTSHPGIRSIWDWSSKKASFEMRKSGNRFMATIEKNGHSKTKSFFNLEDARSWRDRAKFELELCPEVPTMTFGELWSSYFEHKKNRVQLTTLESYETRGRHFLPLYNQNIESFNSRLIDHWLHQVKSVEYFKKMKIRKSRLSFIREVELLREVFGYYREYFNERFENPVRDRHDRDSVFKQQVIDERQRLANQRFISSDQIEKFLGLFRIATESGNVDRIYFYLALIQLRTGLRIGEACALKWEDIEWDTGLITVNKTVQWMRRVSRRSQIRDSTKTGRSRPIWLIPELRTELRVLQISQRRIRGLIFSVDGLDLLKYRSIQCAYDKVFKETHLPFRSTHILRHSFATSFAEKTHDMIALEGVLGHSDPRMTRKYAKITEGTVINGMEVFARSLKN